MKVVKLNNECYDQWNERRKENNGNKLVVLILAVCLVAVIASLWSVL